MEESTNDTPRLNLDDFNMSSYDVVELEGIEKPIITDEDIHDGLLMFVSGLLGRSAVFPDVTDEWVKQNVNGIDSLSELQIAIKGQIEQERSSDLADAKYRFCANELIGRVQGDIDAPLLDRAVEELRRQKDLMLANMGETLEEYLRFEKQTKDVYEEELVDEAGMNLKLNIALDKMAIVNGTTVMNKEIPELLSNDDPESFMNQLEESGQLENARKAAARVKVMRRIIETAVFPDDGAGTHKMDVTSIGRENPFMATVPKPQIRDFTSEEKAEEGVFEIV